MRYILPWVSLSCLFASALGSERWNMHTIDRSSRGADGVRLADVDRDGRLDIVTGWEDSRRIRICFQPTVDRATERWLSVEVGRVKSSEDAVYADVNNDGWLDVISCCEGTERTIYFHINPGSPASSNAEAVVRQSEHWKTEPLQTSQGTRAGCIAAL